MPPDPKRYPLWVVQSWNGDDWKTLLTTISKSRTQSIARYFPAVRYQIMGNDLGALFKKWTDNGFVRCVRCRRDAKTGKIEVAED